MERRRERDKVTETTEAIREWALKEYHRRRALLRTSWAFQTRQFFDNTTLHGVRYINEPNRPFCEKFMWFVFTSVGAVATMVVIVALWEKFQNNPTLTGLDTNYHSWDVKFPAITICPIDPVNYQAIDELRFSYPPHMEAVSCIRNLRTRHAVVIGTHNTCGFSQIGVGNTDRKIMKFHYLVDTLNDMIRGCNLNKVCCRLWGDEEENSKYRRFLIDIANLSYYNLHEFKGHSEKLVNFTIVDLRGLQAKLVKKCEQLLFNCIYKGNRFVCCDRFVPYATENGFCFSFNSRHAYTLQNGTVTSLFQDEQISEMDSNHHMKFHMPIYKRGNIWMSPPTRVYVHSAEEMPIVEIHPLHVWTHDVGSILFSDKETYTTADSRQLTIRQRKCVFPEEIKLETDTYYTFSACMTQCRMRYARRKCKCIPPFYRILPGYKYCDLKGLGCLAEFAHMFQENGLKCKCTFACLNHVYELEKLQEVATSVSVPLAVGFVSWPMVRYKKEVLFGWVDLLVSFGGIAGLFLGFSLLSGVECVYYFMLRSVCMTFRNVEELEDLQFEYDKRERDLLDISLVPTFCRTEKDFHAVIRNGSNTELPLILKPKTYHQIHMEETFMGVTDRIRYLE
ncbi:sodium channel protein Nach-like [Periplaneta americana]|uniref:sodium channel protein Nach-like n=1 Tax=Periplaneta americana TaxID=6978 RepID=UPI0037E7E75F